MGSEADLGLPNHASARSSELTSETVRLAGKLLARRSRALLFLNDFFQPQLYFF